MFCKFKKLSVSELVVRYDLTMYEPSGKKLFPL